VYRGEVSMCKADPLRKDLWTIPRQPIPSRLGFCFSRKAYSVMLGDLRSPWAVWTVINFSPLISDNSPIVSGYNGWRCGMIRGDIQETFRSEIFGLPTLPLPHMFPCL